MTLLCKCMDDTCGNQHYADTLLPPRPVGEGWRATGYEAITIVRTEEGPMIDGPVPNRIGVDRELLDQMVPALGSWTEATGTLIVLGVHYQLIGVDGTDVVVFDRCPA